MSEFKRLQSTIDKKRTQKRTSSSLNPEKRFKLKDAFLESLKEDENKEKSDDKPSFEDYQLSRALDLISAISILKENESL